jgi:hypothetical protein
LAVAASEDPEPYRFRVFIERSNPWDVFIDDDDDKAPIVNVYYQTTFFDKASSNLVTKQTGISRFHVDIFAVATTEETQTGQALGDEHAAKKCQAVARLIRNILMHDDNVQLGLDSVVRYRWIENITSFLSADSNPGARQIRGVRIVVEVGHIETVSQIDEEICDEIRITIRYEKTGQVVASLTLEEA